jgi:uncharacterized protein
MIGLPLAATLAASILSTSFISGIFGMAGGMILLGILLAIMPLAAAMLLHGVTQMTSNGWRAWLWRGHIEWPTVALYALGAIIAAVMFAIWQIVPSKPITLIFLGLISIVGLLVPIWLTPDITRRTDALGCGVLCTTLQILAGVSGPIFDVFFVRSSFNRKQIVATKAAIQVLGHSLKVAYFGQLLATAGEEFALAAMFVAVSFALFGTQLSRRILDSISDAQFRRWTRALVAVIATIYIIQGTVLLAQEGVEAPTTKVEITW